jgi:DNA polymerase-3 subunit epsilon
LSEEVGLEKISFVALDTETTGLYPVTAKLLEIGASRFTLGGEEVAVFERLIQPGIPIPAGAMAVHHITNEMVAGMPPVERVLPAFLDFIDGPETVLLAHNAPFDMEFIGVDLVRLNLPFPTAPVFDTAILARAVLPDLASYRLASLAMLLGVASCQKHRALSDARLAKDVFLALLARAPKIQTLYDLASTAPPLSFEALRLKRFETPPGFEDLKVAIEAGLPITIVYAGGSGSGNEEPRRVSPRSLLRSGRYLYLVAHCPLDGREETYRLDRIISYRVEVE